LNNDPYTDTVRVLGDNNFTGVGFDNIDQLAFGGAATATFDQYFIENDKATVIGDGNANALLFQLVSYGSETPAIDLSKLTFQSWKGKTDSITILGTNVHDSIAGSSRNDLINGKGGSDTLQGKGGKDVFEFDTAFRKGVDHIVDFSRKSDDIHLDKHIFKVLPHGKLDASAFAYGIHATNADQHIIYDQVNGVLRYDKDGNGDQHAHIIADLDNDAILKAGDIFVI
jgi:Ca2+-binding RTX toxin-like protein